MVLCANHRKMYSVPPGAGVIVPFYPTPVEGHVPQCVSLPVHAMLKFN